ncbi:extracellular solute-binding protein [Aliiglaciecola sp. CAU 1673]|uniref:ABC transporter substrate-binding protein n=1 Tax=Aliiglaciecola sp. CAU 1673 TaxID=3032595 RepID=UPI0023DA2563|nr:extracellular solute-binding protein [Aliiglaciecola sp. CAU 1673]MDF2177683.1 extracellular solute-binding protein [Aliiglaciecola sp. CAU 1673]
MKLLKFIALGFSALCVNAWAATTLNILEWEGYISPFKEDFEAHAKSKGMDVKLNILTPYITNSEQIFKDLRANKADVVTPTHNYYKMNQAKLMQVLQPIDTARLGNYSKILASLRIASYDSQNDKKYSVPLLGGSYGLAYNTEKVPAPDSWQVLWDPANAGKYAVTEDQFEANLYTTMLVLGYSPTDVYDVDSGKFNQAQVQEKLNPLVKNAHSFWGGMADADVMPQLSYVTTYWFGVAEANKRGQKWALANPKEGQTVWLDTMAIAKQLSGEKLDAAYLLMDFMIQESTQKRFLEMYGSIIVNGETKALLTPEQIEKGRVGDESFFVEEMFWQPLSSRTRNIYKEMWDKARGN